MHVSKTIRAIISASIAFCLAILVFTLPSLAAGIGSSALIIKSSDLYSGPGVQYPVSGSVQAEQAVTITRCSGIWCLIDDEGGWIAKQDVSFGQHAGGLAQGPRFEDGRSTDGTICFYDGANFSGANFCLSSGAVVTDLALHGWDNRIASISLDAGTSVNVCRDRGFSSYCVLINKDAANLPRLISNSISSFQIWNPISASSANGGLITADTGAGSNNDDREAEEEDLPTGEPDREPDDLSSSDSTTASGRD